MKKAVSLLLTCGSIIALQAQPAAFTLNGDLSRLKAPIEWVYLSYTVNNQRVTDSVLVKQDQYSFKGNLNEPVQAALRIRYKADRVHHTPVPFNSKRDYAIIFLEPGTITASSVDSFANITVSGSAADAAYRQLQEMARPFDNRLGQLYQQSARARKMKNDALAQQVEQQIDSLNVLANERVYGDYVKNHPDAPLALYAFRNWMGYQADAAKVEPVFKRLPAAIRNTTAGRELQEKINIARKTAIGENAPDFTQNDTLGKPVTLHALKGNYLLLDFWASWCIPCRADNPRLVQVFNKYRAKGFSILGISLDKPHAREEWLQAIHDDGLNWIQVSDLGYWNNAAARLYGIEAIPQNLLLDPAGKIIAKNLHWTALDQKLAAIYHN